MPTIAGSRGTVQIADGHIVEIGSWAIRRATPAVNDMGPWEDDAADAEPSDWWTGHARCFWDEDYAADLDILHPGMPIMLNVYPDGKTTGRVCYMALAIITDILSADYHRGSIEALFSFAGHGGLIPATTA